MENFVVKHKVQRVFRKITGGLTILIGLSWILFNLTEGNMLFLIGGIIFTILGVIQLTATFGSDTSEIILEDSYLKIRWVSWYRPKKVSYSDIGKITLTMFDIVLSLKEGKRLKLRTDLLERDEMKKVREFFLKLAVEKGLIYENRYHT